MSLKSSTQGSREISDQESKDLNAVEVAGERDSDSEGPRENDEDDPKRYSRIRLHQVIYVTDTAPIDGVTSKIATGVSEGRVNKYTTCLEKYLDMAGCLDYMTDKSHAIASQTEHHTLNSLQRLQHLQRLIAPSDAKRSLVSDIYDVFNELKYWEQECFDGGSLNQSRDTRETICLRREPDGLDKQYAYLMF